MKKLFLFLAITLLQASAWAATTYTYVGPTSDPATLYNYTSPCALGTCGTYTAATRTTGAFTTAAPLPANAVNLDISSLMTSYSFSDGVTTYSNGDPNITFFGANAYTDAAGAVIAIYMNFQHWQTAAPHTTGSRVDTMQMGEYGSKNSVCQVVQTAPFGDVCTNAGGDASSSGYDADSESTATWTISGDLLPPATVNPVPTLSEWSLALLALMTGAAGWWMARRRTL